MDHGIITDIVYAQTGYSDYQPIRYQHSRFMDRCQYADMEAGADIVITHGGTGTIIGAVKLGKKVIAVPRLAKYGEHVDDHQLQIVKRFEDAGIILACYDLADLGNLYRKLDSIELKPYISNQQKIITSVDEYLESLPRQ